jgi:hypothetical protein
VLLSKHQKWKVVRWVCYLDRKRKSNIDLLDDKKPALEAGFLLGI